jgi:inosine-uridine nucleoside N-ribohydrolase
MDFPQIPESLRLERLQLPTGKVKVVLDTDTYNEIDDQYAVVYALLSPEKIEVEALYAAPFFNHKSTSPADGMEKSYQEILQLLSRLDVDPDEFVFRGSTGKLTDYETPYRSAAALNLVERAMQDREELLVVVAIGALTNIASAILIEPQIIDRMVVVWLGGNAFHWPHNREFNLLQDILAARLLFDCGVPLVQVPCAGVTTHLRTTVPEIDRYVVGRGAIGDYLAETFKSYNDDHFAWSKEIWDVAAIAYLINHEWVPADFVHSPIVTDQITWSFDNSRHFIRYARHLHRDAIFRDMFTKLDNWAQGKIEINR